jgi:hypothetical protein
MPARKAKKTSKGLKKGKALGRVKPPKGSKIAEN